MRNKRKTLGWLGFAAAAYWLWADYQARRQPGLINRAIAAGWATIGLTAAHVMVRR